MGLEELYINPLMRYSTVRLGNYCGTLIILWDEPRSHEFPMPMRSRCVSCKRIWYAVIRLEKRLSGFEILGKIERSKVLCCVTLWFSYYYIFSRESFLKKIICLVNTWRFYNGDLVCRRKLGSKVHMNTSDLSKHRWWQTLSQTFRTVAKQTQLNLQHETKALWYTQPSTLIYLYSTTEVQVH